MLELTSRQFLIIRLLQKNTVPLSANTLSRLLDISPRTLRNDIFQINKNIEDFHISSSKNGYQLTLLSENAHMLINDIKISEQSKSTNIILQYLLNHPSCHLLELSENCYMSESSVARCIKTIKPLLNKYHLTVERKNDIFSLHGSEYDKRALFAHLIGIEASQPITSLQHFQQYFQDFHLSEIEAIIDSVLKKYNIRVDDIHYQNLVMNTSITLQRIFVGSDIEPLPFSYSLSNDEIICQLSKDLCHNLEEYFNLHFAQTDNEYMQVLCIGSIKINEENYETQILYNDYSFVYKIKEILDDLVEHFSLQLNYQMSLNHFALHIHRLFFRNHSSLYFQNDFHNNLKNTHPFIYELAVYFAYKFQESFNITVNINEIGLLAIHLGLMIQSNEENKQYLKALCICPEYNDLRKHFANQFLLNFGDNVQLISFISSKKNIQDYHFDFLISTINDYESPDCMVISPLLLSQDIDKLNLKINLLKEKKKKDLLKKELSKYIDPKLFFRNVDFTCKKDAILFLCSQMLKHGDAKTDFVDSVFEHEKISTTSFFNKFAVPHAIHFGDVKTRITFLLNDKAIPWGDTSVHLVMLISINEKDIMTFNTIYSSIIDLLLDDESFDEMLKIKTFDELSVYLENHV